MKIRRETLVSTARIGTFCLLALVAVPGALAADEPDYALVRKRIDDAIHARLQAEKLKPAPRAGDTRLLRRLYLDLLGRIPTAVETEAFLADSAPDKIHKVIDQLLSHPEMPVYWRRVVDGWFNGAGGRQSRQAGHEDFLAFLERSLATNKPWDRLARELLLPSAMDAEQRGASYFLARRLQGEKAAQLDNITTSVASALFGVQLQCARCHDHPFVDEWKQDHYYGLAAFFSRVEAKNANGRFVVNERPAGEVKFVTRKKKEKTAAAMFLDSKVLDAAATVGRSRPEKANQPAQVTNRRQKLADHALKAESPYFKRAFINRLWKQLLGRGLVEPVDQMHSANPASHPDLLIALADDFAGHGFDLRRLIAGILHSDTYLRDSRFPGAKRPLEELYAAAILKPLSGEQMAWSLVVATGYTDQLATKYTRELRSAPAKGEVNPILRNRWERDQEFDQVAEKFRYSGESFQANASQALFVTFNPFSQKLLQPLPGNLVQRLLIEKDNQRAVRSAFLAILSRPPSAAELQETVAFLETGGERKQACADLVWALLAGAEFRFNH